MSDKVLSLDLAPMLAAGTDPLSSVVDQAGRIPQGGQMLLSVPFNPVPLRNVLARMGFSSSGEQLAAGQWVIRLVRDGKGEVERQTSDEDCVGLPPGAPIWRDDNGTHIDVRGLAMPLPMLAILRLAGSLTAKDRVWVHHDRDPIFLYPELAEIGWTLDPAGYGNDGALLFELRHES